MNKIIFILLLLACGCQKSGKTLKIAASSLPHSEMLATIKPDLAKDGIHLEIIEVDDYNIPNRALVDKDVDANFFQHAPYLASQIEYFDFPITILCKVHIEPMGVYSKEIDNLNDLPEGAKISLPNDPTNEARALILLHHNGIITLDDPANIKATTRNVTENPKNITLIEMDSQMLARTLEDVNASVIPTNYALRADLKPARALAREDTNSDFANVIVVRKGAEDKKAYQALKEAMCSEKMRAHIEENYKGAIVSVF